VLRICVRSPSAARPAGRYRTGRDRRSTDLRRWSAASSRLLARFSRARLPSGLIRRHASALDERAPEQELDLRVQTAQLGPCPALQRVVHLGVEAKWKALAFAHGVDALLIERTRVDHRLDA